MGSIAGLLAFQQFLIPIVKDRVLEYKNGEAMRGYSVNPIEVRRKAAQEHGVYASLVAISKRANGIMAEIKEHIYAKLAPYLELGGENSDDEDDTIDHEQLEISKEFDTIPKPTILAMKEFLEDRLKFRIEEKEEPQRRRIRRGRRRGRRRYRR